MKIKVIVAFEDLQEPDSDKRLRAVDTDLTVTRERGTQLCGLGLAIDITTHDDAPAQPAPVKLEAQSKRGRAQVAATPPAPPAAPPAPTPDPASTECTPFETPTPDPAASAA